MKPYLLRFHRWITLVFALPLAVLIITGLILSFEPIATVTTIKPGSLQVAQVEQILKGVDPAGGARSLSYRAYENRLSIGGVRPDDTIDIDMGTGLELEEDGPLSNLFYQSRMLHEHLIYDLGWLVTASTIAMVVIALIGVVMGWPRLRNSLSGWHQAMAWFALPLVILSPLTGLALAFGITFTSPPTGPRAEPMKLIEAVQIIAREKDLSTLVWLRGRGGRLLARMVDNGEYRVFAVTKDGLQATSRNWPRLIHEGNWMGVVSAGLNVIVSLVFVGLMVTGLIIWARRKFRRRPQRQRQAELAPAE